MGQKLRAASGLRCEILVFAMLTRSGRVSNQFGGGGKVAVRHWSIKDQWCTGITCQCLYLRMHNRTNEQTSDGDFDSHALPAALRDKSQLQMSELFLCCRPKWQRPSEQPRQHEHPVNQQPCWRQHPETEVSLRLKTLAQVMHRCVCVCIEGER